MFLADKDPFSNPDDVYDFVNNIEKKETYINLEFIENYNHVDFLWSNDAIFDIYPKIMQFLEE